MNRIKKILRKIKSICKKGITLLFYFCPIKKNKITFCNFMGKGYGCNPKYLAEEFLKDEKYELIWFVSNINDESIPKKIKKVKYGSLKHYYHLITAKLWIDNIRNNPKPIFKRRNQVYLQTWHGGLCLKAIEKDAEESLSKHYINLAKKDSKMAKYMLSNCRQRTELIKQAFWYDGCVLEMGIPKNDILYNLDNKKVELLKKKYHIESKSIVLYAPSFRKNKDFYSLLEFSVDELISELNKKFNKDFVFCYRLHPNDSMIKSKFNNVQYIDLTQESDSQIVLAASDVVISDYSNMLLDFTLTKKLALIYAPDYEEYIKNDRRLYINLKECGIPFAETFEQLVQNIKNNNMDKYVNDINKFHNSYGIFDNQESSKKIKKFLEINDI